MSQAGPGPALPERRIPQKESEYVFHVFFNEHLCCNQNLLSCANPCARNPPKSMGNLQKSMGEQFKKKCTRLSPRSQSYHSLVSTSCPSPLPFLRATDPTAPTPTLPCQPMSRSLPMSAGRAGEAGWPAGWPGWLAELACRVGCPGWLAGRAGCPSWLAGLAGRADWPGWLARLAGRVGWPGWLANLLAG